MATQVYQLVTYRIIGQMKNGTFPCHLPWNRDLPKNLVSGKTYRGINIFLLGASGYMNQHWLTFNQATDLGGMVNKGEKSTMVVFWKMWEKKDKEGREERIQVRNMFRCFNVM